MRPPLARRTVSVRRVRPGRKRSWPMRSSGPLGTSRIPVASTTMAPGSPCAKRSYHSMTSSVTKPSSVARHGTMAGTQVRWASDTGPISTAENKREAAASDAEGMRPAAAVNLMRCGGRHTCFPPRFQGDNRPCPHIALVGAAVAPAGAHACQYGPKPIARARADCRQIIRVTRKAPVAQLDRAPDYKSGGQD